MPDVVCIGETMLRLSAPAGSSLENTPYLQVDVAGAESNVAIGLSRLGVSVGWISRLPDNSLGRRVADVIRGQGVDVSRVVWAPEGRLGVYFIELGQPPRPSQIIYDRAHSAMAQMQPDEVDWDYVRQAEIVHLTGITPALSPSCHQIVQRAFAEAKEAGVRVSFDVNYRAKLWSPEEARACLGRLAAEADILISTLSDAAILCARGGDAETLVRQLAACMKCETGIAVVTDGDRGAIALYQGELFQVEGYEVQVVDRVGAGDAFAAGFLCGLLEEGIKQGLEYGIALAALKHTYYGDIAWCTREDLQRVITGSTEEGWR